MAETAKQPRVIDPAATSSQAKLVKRVESRSEEMKAARRPFDPLRREITAFLRPELSMYEIEGGIADTYKPNQSVFSARPQEGLETWSTGMQGQTASASFKWFGLRMDDEKLNKIPAIRDWFQHLEERQYSIMNNSNSNFYQHLGPIFRDAGSYGDAASWIEKSKEGKGINCTNFHLKECFVDENEQGRVDTFYRFPFDMTARQAVDRFGEDNLSETLVKAYKEMPQTKFKFIHATHVRTDPIFKGVEDALPRTTKGRKYISIYVEMGVADGLKKPALIEGYFTKPFSYWRFSKSPDTAYGCGLGCFAMVDIFGINAWTEIMLRSGHLAVDPSMYVDEGMRGRVTIDPGSWVYGSKEQHIPQVIFDGGKYPVGIDLLERVGLSIDRWFNVDVFQMMRDLDTAITIPHLMAKLAEKAVIMGPRIGRLNSELYTSQHDRIFDIQFREGWVDPPPSELTDRIEEGDGFQMQYNGVLEQAQRKNRQLQNTELFVAQIRPILEVAPDTADNTDWDKMYLRISRESDIPEDEIRDKEDVKQTRVDRAEQEAAAAQAEMLLEAAKVAPQLNQAPEEGSPAQRLQETEA